MLAFVLDVFVPVAEEEFAGDAGFHGAGFAFVDALLAGDKISFHDWEASTPYFDGCLPIEVMAERGRETLRHGPMKSFMCPTFRTIS